MRTPTPFRNPSSHPFNPFNQPTHHTHLQSTPKHFCKYCNVWMHDNKPSIRHHEGGTKHKEAMENFFREKREAKQGAAMGDKDLNKELREIEKAALAQAAQDAAMFGGAAAALPPLPPARTLQPPGGRKPPPPPTRRDDGGGGYRRDKDEDEQEKIERLKAQAQAKAEAVELEGRYTVDGITYLEGKRFDAKLTTGTACQLWVEAADEWAEARILRVQVTAVPNTDLVLRKFTVAYRLSTQAAEEEEEQEEEDVIPDRLRMVEAQVKKLPPPPPAVEQSTGLGGWQTVAVREVDEEAERRAGIAAMKEEAKRRKEEEALQRLKLMEDALEGEDAMSSYDPHGRGMYKGIDLKASATAELNATVEVDLGGDKDGPVAFKKKRPAGGGGGGGAAKFRRKRTTDEDD